MPFPTPSGGGSAGLDHDEFSAAVTSVTSAFGDPTRRDIYLLIRDAADGVTAGEVAERFELHPNVARHHLEKLTGGGYLVVAVDRTDGARAAGRPSKRYRVSEHDHSLNFPPRRDDLLGTLLAARCRCSRPRRPSRSPRRSASTTGAASPPAWRRRRGSAP